jgi:hypothetical protein
MFTPFNAVQIRVSLDDIEPPAWRRLIVPIDWNLEQLHLTIQAVKRPGFSGGSYL